METAEEGHLYISSQNSAGPVRSRASGVSCMISSLLGGGDSLSKTPYPARRQRTLIDRLEFQWVLFLSNVTDQNGILEVKV